MHRDIVEKRKWITENDYREGLTLSQLVPGPLAAQLGIYIGCIQYKLLGATLVGDFCIAFFSYGIRHGRLFMNITRESAGCRWYFMM